MPANLFRPMTRSIFSVAPLLMSLAAAQAQKDSDMRSWWPTNHAAPYRAAVTGDFAPKGGQTPTTGGQVSPNLFLADVVVNNTDTTLNASDTFGDEEPSIAINPANPNEIVITSFCE